MRQQHQKTHTNPRILNGIIFISSMVFIELQKKAPLKEELNN